MAKITYKGGREIAPKRTKEKILWWRYLLVFLTGMVTMVVVLAATGALTATTYTTKELILMFSGNPDDLLQAEYQNLSILELITTLSQKKFETLGDINSVTPLVKKTLEETINPVLEAELHYAYPWEEISTKPFKLPASDREGVDQNEDLSTYLGRAIKEGVTLSSFFNGDNIPELVNLFLYPKDEYGNYDHDHPYTLMDFITADSTFFDNIINGIRIKDVIAIDPSDALLSTIGDWKITDFNQENINTLSLSLFLDSTSTNPLIVTLCTWTIGDLKNPDQFNSLKIADLVTVDENTPQLLIALINKDYTIADLQSQNLYNVLTIGEVFDTTGNKFLQAISGFTLAQLQDYNTIMGLKLGELFDVEGEGSIVSKFADTTIEELTSDDWFSNLKITDLYTADEIASNSILSALVGNNPNIKISDLSDASVIQSLTIADVLSPEQVAANSIMTALKDYPIGELGDHINDISLGTLLDIDVSDPSTSQLMKTIAGTAVGDLNDKLDNLTLGDVMDLSSYPNLDNDEVKNTSIHNFDNIIDTLKDHLTLKDVVDIVTEGENKSPQILITLKDTPLLELADVIPTLKLNQIVPQETLNTHPLLLALANVAILDGDALVDKVNSLELCDIYTRDQCSGILLTIWDNYGGGHLTIDDLPSAINDLPLVQLLDEYMYEESTHPEATRIIDGVTYRRIKAVWWYLFTQEGESFTNETKYYVLGAGATYKVDGGFDQMVTNMTYHMANESIRDLNSAGLLNLKSENVGLLDYPINYAGKHTIGDLTVSEFFDYCMSIITSLNP